VRDIMQAPNRLTIVQTDSLVIVTTDEGRVVRLAPNRKGVKDESTGIERKTRWEGPRLITEITGGGARKMIETYAVDPQTKQLHLTLQIDSPQRPVTINRVYDPLG
jgi:hypothetical protein